MMIFEWFTFGKGIDWIGKLWGKLWKWRKKYMETLNEINNEIYADPLDTAQYYIEPNCQNINPADTPKEGFMTVTQPVMKILDGFFTRPENDPGENQLFILSDAGMGKTALLTMLKLADLTAFWPKNTKSILKKLGENTLDELKQIRERTKTILLLDSLDEDPMAYGRVRERILEILRETRNFEKVVITCRTQFFPKAEDDPFKRPNMVNLEGFICPVIYLSFFSDAQVRAYLEKRFEKKYRFWTDTQKMEEAEEMIRRMGSLKCRPMLLSYIENLMEAPVLRENAGEYAVYDALVNSWLNRERLKSDINPDDLLQACIVLALVLHCDGKRDISEENLDRLIEQYSAVTPIKEIHLKGRSLINKNSDGDYRFSHYSIQEFCVTKMLLDGGPFTPKKTIHVTNLMLKWIAETGGTPNYSGNLDFNDCKFDTMDLQGLSLREMNLQGNSICSADLKRADFSKSNLRGVDFGASELVDAQFVNSNLTGADFRGADLSGADFRDAILNRTNFRYAQCRNTDFRNAKIENADFNGADIRTAHFDWETQFTNSLGMTFVWIPPGTFTMGSPSTEDERYEGESMHEVVLKNGFYLQTTPVTQGQWVDLMVQNPSSFKNSGKNGPVETVSWEDVMVFIRRLNERGENVRYRLPTEAEWEYACRAGTTTRFYTGDSETDLERAGWYIKNSKNQTHPVGQKEANLWGLYDMHGNVWEWVEDDWHEDSTGAPTDGSAWIDSPRGSDRVLRGGSWRDGARYCRSAYRYYSSPGNRLKFFGFRLACSSGQ